MKKKLSLSKQTVRHLTKAKLSGVAGGITGGACISPNSQDCTQLCTDNSNMCQINSLVTYCYTQCGNTCTC